jgi:alpha-1,2-mannosyltransferase
MWNAAPGTITSRGFVAIFVLMSTHTAFLPSSFAMYATTLAFAYALEPSTVKNKQRTLFVTMLFATGAIVGWPFALALSLPFVFEELFLISGDRVEPSVRSSWMISRWKGLFIAGLTSSLIFVGVH